MQIVHKPAKQHFDIFSMNKKCYLTKTRGGQNLHYVLPYSQITTGEVGEGDSSYHVT